MVSKKYETEFDIAISKIVDDLLATITMPDSHDTRVVYEAIDVLTERVLKESSNDDQTLFFFSFWGGRFDSKP